MENALKKAFTMVEILIVVVILGILAAIVVPRLSGPPVNQFQATLSTPSGKKTYTFGTGDQVTIKDRADMTTDRKRLPEGTYTVKITGKGDLIVLTGTLKDQPGLNLTRAELESEAAYSIFDFKKKL